VPSGFAPVVNSLNRCCSIALLTLALGGNAGAQTAPGTPAPIEGDRAEVASIVMHAVTEVKLCDLAVEKSQDAGVRSLCRKAAADSARTAIQGMQLAQTIGATAAKLQPSPDTPDVLNTLEHYTGHDFDRKFLLGEIEDDEDAAHAIRYAAEVATDTSVKRYENSVLPKIENHLELAESALRGVSEAAPP